MTLSIFCSITELITYISSFPHYRRWQTLCQCITRFLFLLVLKNIFLKSSLTSSSKLHRLLVTPRPWEGLRCVVWAQSLLCSLVKWSWGRPAGEFWTLTLCVSLSPGIPGPLHVAFLHRLIGASSQPGGLGEAGLLARELEASRVCSSWQGRSCTVFYDLVLEVTCVQKPLPPYCMNPGNHKLRRFQVKAILTPPLHRGVARF